MITDSELTLIINPSEIPVGGVFYRKEPDGTFSKCSFDREELSDPMTAEILKFETANFCAEKRLFKSRQKGYRKY
jgi:hypothetical protein